MRYRVWYTWGMEKHTQHDLVVLWLARSDGWYKGYELKGRPIDKEFIGSEADTRLYELFDKCVTDEVEKQTTRIIDGAEYTIHTKKDGGNRVYRAYLSKEKPKATQLTYDPINNRMVRV